MRKGEDRMLPGFRYLPGHLDSTAQKNLTGTVFELLEAASPYRPTMPGSGRPLSIDMSNAGPLGWLTDRHGYRYSPNHPETGAPWPPIPRALLELWDDLADFAAPPECCLVNLYRDPKARLGLHRDSDEETFEAPVLSVSLGDTAVFRVGGTTRRGSTRSLRLASGDVVLLGGEARRAYHGIDRLLWGSSRLIPGGGRINLTLRRVTPVSESGQESQH